MPAMLLPREFFLPCAAALTLERGNDLSQNAPPRGGRLAPPGGRFGAGRVSGDENSPLALSRSAGCGTGRKGQAV